MSFHLYEGNDLDALAAQLAELLADRAGSAQTPDPFFLETVTVPNQGLARWLSMRIAECNGLCPAIDFPYPGAFIYRHVFNPMAGHCETSPAASAEDELPFNPATVRWRILKLLPRLEADPAFARVQHFVADDQFRRYQLAGRLAQLFDRYMTYRPDMLAAWEQGAQPVAGVDAQWQSLLWRGLIGMDAGATRHFSGLYQRFIQATAPSASPPAFLRALLQKRRVFYFGVSSLPPAHLDILFRLAAFPAFEIHFFAVNPCREEWSGARSLKGQLRDQSTLVQAVGAQQAEHYTNPSNPLLGSLGRSGQEFFALLLAYDTVDSRPLFKGPDATSRTALAVMQRDILDNIKPTKSVPFDPGDRSISIHSCHSPMREVEVLHDQLLHLFSTMPNLAPREINVYTPKIEVYAPYIDAVFGRTRLGEVGHVPYTIADKSLAHEYAECQAFLSLLTVATSRFKASEVLGLLENATIRARFGFTADALPRLGALLKQAHLAWGLDADFRARHGTSALQNNTWEFALNRLILGAAMWDTADAAEPLETDGTACVPCHDADGQAAVLGRLADFIAALKHLHALCAAERACADWRLQLESALARFFAPDEQAPYGVILMRQTLDRFAQFTQNAGCEGLALPFSVIFAWLKEQLAGAPGSERFVTGKVTFSRFQPMRNVPSRVVCMLGMNDGDFPSVAASLSFDLMDRRTRRKLGDRQTRDEERYAFLETLMAARERLLITYTGQSAKDNKPLPPSVLVSELLDAVDASFDFTDTPQADATHQPNAADLLTVRHPLHPFSPSYFRAHKTDDRLVSFSESYYQVAAQLESANSNTGSQANTSPPPDPGIRAQTAAAAKPAIIELDDLISFCRSPCKYFYTRRLGVYLDIRADEMPADEETLEPKDLMRFELKDRLLRSLDKAPDLDARAAKLRVRWEAEGYLVPGTQQHFDAALAVVRQMLEAKHALNLGTPDSPLFIDIPLDVNLRLQGRMPTYNDKKHLLAMRPAQEKPKHIVVAWLRHVAACAAGLEAQTYTIFTDNESARCDAYARLERPAALAILNLLAKHFTDGAQRPLCFDPAIGYLIAQGKADKVTEACWSGDYHHEGTDIYNRREFGDTLPDPASEAWRTMEQMALDLFSRMPGGTSR